MRSYFEREWLDNALTVGMTPDEFWYGDPELFYNYCRVYTERYKLEQQNVWQIGARMCQALSSSLIFPAGVVDKTAIKNMPQYPPCPYTDEDKPQEEELNEEQKELYRQRFIVSMMNWVGKNHEKGD